MYRLTASGSQSAQFEVKPADVTIDAGQTATVSVKAGDPLKSFTITGTYLKNVAVWAPTKTALVRS
jgi:hypothetical protein